MLEKKIKFFNGVGPKMAEKLNRLGIETAKDLLFYFPRSYRDYTQISKIADLRNTTYDIQHTSNAVTIRGRIVGIANKRTSRRRFTVTEAVVEDGTGTLKVVWFNQPFLTKMLSPGREVILNGKVEYNHFSHELVMESPERTSSPAIVPVYSETSGITSRYISKLVYGIRHMVSEIHEWLPEEWLVEGRRLNAESETTPMPLLNKEGKGEVDNLAMKQPASPAGGFSNCLNLMPIADALTQIHLPADSNKLHQAQRRLAFDELFLISLKSQLSKEEIKKENAPAIITKVDAVAQFVDNLPFKLTNDQRKAAWQILKDMAGKTSPQPSPSKGEVVNPMNRLLNGDVGSGKTVVAAIAAFAAIKAGFKVALMAPTEILAQQHFKTLCTMFKNHSIGVGLWTSNCKDFRLGVGSQEKGAKNPKHLTPYPLLCDLVIGTQALIQKDIKLENLGLVIVDEQHRFGVKQRAALLNAIARSKHLASRKSPNTTYDIQHTAQKVRAHFLSMTATPIPRTMHLALFGDLDLTLIKEKPKSRKEIKTRFVDPFNREKAYEFIRGQIKKGRQAFIVCPLIEDNQAQSSKLKVESSGEHSVLGSVPATDYQLRATSLFDEDRKSVVAESEKLKQIFPEFKIGMLHGRLKGKEKDEVMSQFAKGSIDILVSTSVVEVGVDIPNATVMMIEDADRFGLAQIHQFRGRVGRAQHQSYCFLFSSTANPKTKERLQSLETTSDGFKLAEIDLETRGPGAIFGLEQSGMLDLKMASISDRILIEEVSEAAKGLVASDPELNNHRELREKLKDYFMAKHME